MEYRPYWKVGTREIGLVEILGAYFCIEIWKQTMTLLIPNEYQPATLNFPVALPLTRIVYLMSYAVTFGDSLRTCKKRIFPVKWNIGERKMEENKHWSIEWNLCGVKNKDIDQGKCVSFHLLAKQYLVVDLKFCALSQSLTPCMNTFSQ